MTGHLQSPLGSYTLYLQSQRVCVHGHIHTGTHTHTHTPTVLSITHPSGPSCLSASEICSLPHRHSKDELARLSSTLWFSCLLACESLLATSSDVYLPADLGVFEYTLSGPLAPVTPAVALQAPFNKAGTVTAPPETRIRSITPAGETETPGKSPPCGTILECCPDTKFSLFFPFKI